MADLAPMQTISAKSHVVRRGLLDLMTLMRENCTDGLSDLQHTAAADCLDRFSLWAGNMGAMRSPLSPLSLDQRLGEAVDVREQINRQLDEIIEATTDLTNIIQHVNPRRDTAVDASISSDLASAIGLDPTDESNDVASDEADMLLQIISESIKSLLRLGILVRKVAPRDRFRQALVSSDTAFLEWFDINYVAQRYEKLGNSQLSNRLGSAIAKRRQFIKYCRDHRSRLGLDEATRTHDATASERLSSKATTFAPVPDLQMGNILEEEYDGISLASASTMANSSSSLKLPQLDDLSRAHEPFECPICFTLRCFKSERAWQIHAFSDLKAYVCTMGGRDCDAEFFGNRDTWFEHELRKHRCQYTCTLCSQGNLSFRGLQAHVAESHGLLSDTHLEMLRDAGREIPATFKAKNCPFCDEWADTLLSKTRMKGRASDTAPDILVSLSRFKRHVATHQEQLAIFAVPRATEAQDVSGHGSTATLSSVTTAPPPLQVMEDVEPMDVEEEVLPTGAGEINDNMDIDDETGNSPLQKTVNPAINTSDGNSASEAAINNVRETNEEQIFRTSIDEGKEPEMQKKAATPRPFNEPTTYTYVDTWDCCQCGSVGHLYQVMVQCSEHMCQHRRCPSCQVSRERAGPRRASR
ncbi:hypothetical protein J3F83DRAFT_725355 [Trichoderma novae-zelandiae]